MHKDPILKMDRKQIESMQERKLRSFFREQIPMSPFYRAKFKELKLDPSDIRTVRDLQKLPLTTKKDIAPDKDDPERYKKFVLQPTEELLRAHWPKGKLLKIAARKATGANIKEGLEEEYLPVHLIATSGTTGVNVPFMYSKYDLDLFGRSYVRSGNIVKMPRDTRLLNLFPFAPHLAFYFALMAGQQGGWFMYHTGGGAVTPTSKSIDLAQKLKATAFSGIPSYIYHLCLKAVEAGAKFEGMQFLLTAGERFPNALKFKIEKLLDELGSPNVRTLDVYGTTEMRTACPECKPHTDAFHVHPDLFIYELVDPKTGEQVNPGERGTLAVTSIDGRGTCVVRYLIGDIFEHGYETGPCPDCGYSLPRLMGPVGRSKDYDEQLQLTKIKGNMVNLYNFHEVLPAMDAIQEWQVIIAKRNNDPYEIDELTINVTPRCGTNIPDLTRAIVDKIQSVMEITPKVEIFPSCDVLFESMGGQIKPKRILDSRPKQENGSANGNGTTGVSNRVTNGIDVEAVKPNGPKIAN
jgi:phenylacetate-CoA ligase